MVMQIWCACTRFFKQRASEEINSLQSLIEKGFIYTCEKVYLGKKGKLVSPDCNNIAEWFYTERDGIFTQIKRKKPYKILFEYSEGNYFINDDRENVCKSLTELKDNLDRLRNERKANNHVNAYSRVESIISQTLARLWEYQY